MKDFAKLAVVYEKARDANVSFSMNYDESNDMFAFTIISAAPSEMWAGKDHSFDIAIEDVLEWLDALKRRQ